MYFAEIKYVTVNRTLLTHSHAFNYEKKLLLN